MSRRQARAEVLRRAREFALQILFHIDVGRADPETALAHALDREGEGGDGLAVLDAGDRVFVRELVQGAWARHDEIDKIIAAYAKEWTVERMAGVDRNIMRLAIHEMTRPDGVPPGVAADEAVELAKTFSTAESGKFINGILGSVIRGLKQGAPSAEPNLPGS